MSNLNTNGQKKFGVIDYVWFVLSVIGIVGIILIGILYKKYITASYIIGLLSSLILSSFIIYIFIEYFINKNYSRRMKWLIAFFINLFFIMTPTMLVYSYPVKLNKLYFIATSLIIYILLMIIIYHSTRIENRDDISLLKAMNLFIVFSLTAIIFLNKELEFSSKENNFLTVDYLLLPLTGLQGLFELFDGKSKLKEK